MNISILEKKWLEYTKTKKESNTDHILECDGLTRVITYILQTHNVSHRVCTGRINGIWHMWVKLPDGRHIDYRVRMWLSDHNLNDLPHGIFDPEDYPLVNYIIDTEDDLSVSEFIFNVLTNL